MWKIVGYGPSAAALPFVPDFILVQDDHLGTRCILRSDPRTGSEEPVPGVHVAHSGGVPFADGMWVCIESDAEARTFLASAEKEFRSRRAQELAAYAMTLKGDPVRTLEIVQAAGALQGMDVPGLARRLQHSQERPDEPLPEVLERLRRTSK